jgi:D-hexose-6-phosphate mutarotase
MTLTIPGILRLEQDAQGLSRFVITNTFAEAVVYLLGAQVTDFRPVDQQPVLWLSPLSPFEKGKAIRGGIPVCWPWFGPHPSRPDLPAHGLARTREWQPLDAAQLSDGRTRLRLRLSDSDETRQAWPHKFDLTLTVTVGPTLDLELSTTNTGDTPFSYTDALHTYLHVSDVRQTQVSGLEGAAFVHSTRGFRGVQTGPFAFGDEVNNIFVPNRGPVSVFDPVTRRTLNITKSGSLATVVWNPGEASGGAMKDVRAHWGEFVCVEAATCADARIVLLPGSSHTTSQGIEIGRQGT